MIAGVLVLVLVKPPVLPPLPGERTMEAEEPSRSPEPTPKPKPTPNPIQDPNPTPIPNPKPTPNPIQDPTPTPTPNPNPNPNPTPAPPAMPSQIQAASDAEVAELRADDRAAQERAGADAEAPTRDALPGDRPLRTPARDEATLHRTAIPATPPPLTYKRRPKAPDRTSAFAFGYRLFAITDALGRPQSWHLGSVEVSPLRRWVRLDFITEIGAEGGAAARDGDRADLMFVEKGSLGVQYPGWVTPFVAFQGGAGFARVELFDRNDLVFLYTLGLDVGAQWAVTKWLFLHAAIGWIHPTFRRPEHSVHYDAFTFKLGFGM